jgi:hypothetical protein
MANGSSGDEEGGYDSAEQMNVEEEEEEDNAEVGEDEAEEAGELDEAELSDDLKDNVDEIESSYKETGKKLKSYSTAQYGRKYSDRPAKKLRKRKLTKDEKLGIGKGYMADEAIDDHEVSDDTSEGENRSDVEEGNVTNIGTDGVRYKMIVEDSEASASENDVYELDEQHKKEAAHVVDGALKKWDGRLRGKADKYAMEVEHEKKREEMKRRQKITTYLQPVANASGLYPYGPENDEKEDEAQVATQRQQHDELDDFVIADHEDVKYETENGEEDEDAKAAKVMAAIKAKKKQIPRPQIANGTGCVYDLLPQTDQRNCFMDYLMTLIGGQLDPYFYTALSQLTNGQHIMPASSVLTKQSAVRVYNNMRSVIEGRDVISDFIKDRVEKQLSEIVTNSNGVAVEKRHARVAMLMWFFLIHQASKITMRFVEYNDKCKGKSSFASGAKIKRNDESIMHVTLRITKVVFAKVDYSHMRKFMDVVEAENSSGVDEGAEEVEISLYLTSSHILICRSIQTYIHWTRYLITRIQQRITRINSRHKEKFKTKLDSIMNEPQFCMFLWNVYSVVEFTSLLYLEYFFPKEKEMIWSAGRGHYACEQAK